MVLSERNSDHTHNGRRSRGGSPNGHISDSSSDDDREGDGGMRVGRDYQAVVPPLIPSGERHVDQCPDRALLVWSPTPSIMDLKLDEYITLAKEKYSYNAEQALGMLFWHKHDLEKAISDLANFTPFPDEWTVEDKVLFEQAFQYHGKAFHRIRQMLPDKSIACLVKYYYSWKKTRTRMSLMDKQARKLSAQREEGGSEGGGSEVGSNSDSDDDKHDPKRTINRGIRRETGLSTFVTSSEEKDDSSTKLPCGNCGISCTSTHSTSKGNLCYTCAQYWRRNGSLRPTTGILKREGRDRHHAAVRHKRKPPRGMYINHDDLRVMSSGPTGQGEAMLKAMERETVSLKRQVQNNKQMISSLKRITGEGIDEYRITDSSNRINARWTNDELLLAVQGVRKYGKDFKAIAEVIGNKTEAHLRTFFVNYRRRYNLDAVLKEYEAENGPVAEEEKEEKMEVDSQNMNETTTLVPTTGTSITVSVLGKSSAAKSTPIAIHAGK